jgi:hypothetical protein
MTLNGPYRPDWDPGTWQCHICKEERPDAKISVHKNEFTTPTGVKWGENVRYCNDRPNCVAEAPFYHHFNPNILNG